MARTRITTADLTKLLRRTPQPVYVLDAERTIIFCNRACGDWTGVEPAALLGRRTQYDAQQEGAGPSGVAAGLCPPPEAFAGCHVIGHVRCLASDGRQLDRRARFVPLGESAQSCVGVIALVEPTDLPPDSLPWEHPQETSADALHVAIRRFRAAQSKRYSVTQLIGHSSLIRRAREVVALAASSRTNVLIVGPSGSGREHVARTIFYESLPADEQRLIPCDCRLAGDNPVHRMLDAAARGEPAPLPQTLLLLHVDQLSSDGQTLLADALKEPNRGLRFISTATARLGDLEPGRFRRDTAHALSTLEIELPSVAERLDDLPLLCQVFLEDENRRGGHQVAGIQNDALQLLATCHWPENLDSLRDVIREAHAACQTPTLRCEDLPSRVRHAMLAADPAAGDEGPIVLDEFLAKIETELLRRALKRSKGNKTKAAELLGLTRPRLYRRMVQLGLDEGTT